MIGLPPACSWGPPCPMMERNDIFPKDSFLDEESSFLFSLQFVWHKHAAANLIPDFEFQLQRLWLVGGWKGRRGGTLKVTSDIIGRSTKNWKKYFLRKVDNKKADLGDASGDIWQYWSCRLSPPSGIRNNVCLTMERHPWRRTKKIPPFSRITTTIYCRSDPGLTAMHDKLNKYICAAFQRWPVVVQWVSVAPTLSGWTFVVRFAIFLHHNMPFPFVSSSFSSIMQHHHQHRKDKKCKSHAMYSFPWKIYSRNHFPDFSDQIQDYISLIANSLFLYLATLVQVKYICNDFVPCPPPPQCGRI